MYELLEHRRLLAAAFDASASGGLLSVQVNASDHHVSVVERNGGAHVEDSESGQTADFGGINHIAFKGSGGTDHLFYDGNSVGATVLGGGGNDELTVIDRGTGSSYADGEGGDDDIILIYGNNTTCIGGGGGDHIFVNQGGGDFTDLSGASAIVDAGGGADTVVTYGGNNTINGGGGKDTLIDASGGTANNTVINVENSF